jgi:amphi-Trp domain-containing protein
MSLLEFSKESMMRREAVAERLRQLADQLERHNDLEFELEGIRYTVDVPDQVKLEVEYELDDDESSLEIEITW